MKETWYEMVVSLSEGIIMGLLGEETSNGLFEVKDHCFADLPFPSNIPKGLSTDDKYVIIFGNASTPCCLTETM